MRLYFAFLMFVAALPLQAADEPAPAESPAAEERDDDTAASDAEDPALAEEIREAEAAAATEPPANPNEPFIPSVQISEDLSVSFPVDI